MYDVRWFGLEILSDSGEIVANIVRDGSGSIRSQTDFPKPVIAFQYFLSMRNSSSVNIVLNLT